MSKTTTTIHLGTELAAPTHKWVFDGDHDFCKACGYVRLAVEGSYACSGHYGQLGHAIARRT